MGQEKGSERAGWLGNVGQVSSLARPRSLARAGLGAGVRPAHCGCCSSLLRRSCCRLHLEPAMARGGSAPSWRSATHLPIEAHIIGAASCLPPAGSGRHAPSCLEASTRSRPDCSRPICDASLMPTSVIVAHAPGTRDSVALAIYVQCLDDVHRRMRIAAGSLPE